MIGESGQGAYVPGFGAPRQDRRVLDLVLDNLGDGYNRRAYKTPSDVLRNFVLQRGALGGDNRLSFGTVVYTFPALGWYRVQLTGGGGTVPCCKLSQADTGPLGVRAGGGIAPYSVVVVLKPADVEWGMIVGALPPLMCDPRILVPGWVQQGGQSGVKREAAYAEVQKMLYEGGGVQDFGGMAPMDGTALDKNLLAETGVGWHVDPAMAFVRAGDACGLWVTLFDQYMRQAALNLDVVTPGHHLLTRQDEGELRYEERVALHPWEATGGYAPTPFGQDWADAKVHFTDPVGKVDLPAAERDVQPFFRSTRYGGYLGQGWMRQVIAPAEAAGRRRYTDRTADVGLFRESVAADGAAMWESAKGLFLVKRPRIVVPKEVRPPEHGDGDDGRAGNYKFSGQFGGGAEHRVGDVAAPGPAASMLRVAGVMEVLAHHWNWKALHPFHYHAGDYYTPQEEETPGFDRVSDVLDFTPLGSGSVMPDPEPKTLTIDHRYTEVDYYQRASFLAFFDDGSVALGSGCGGQLAFANGNVTVEAPGEVRARSGTRTLLMGREVYVRGHGSVDVTSATQEVRLAAHKKVQVLGQSVLVQSKGGSKQYDYRNKIGEDVKSAGILFKTDTDFVVLADDVYVRSGIAKTPGGGYATDGGSGGSGGDIVLDAKKKGKDVVLRGKSVTVLAEDALAVWHGPPDGTPTQTHQFRDTVAELSTSLIVRGQIVGCGRSGLIIDGSIGATGSIACAKSMAHRKGPFVGTVPSGFAAQIKQIADAARSAVEATIPIGGIVEKLQVAQKWTTPPTKPGNDAAIKDIGFSFRDDEGKQYKLTGGLMFFEARWEALARQGAATGVRPWDEEPLSYQGRNLRAYPGETEWTGSGFLQSGSPTLFEPGAGSSAARPGPYEAASLGGWDRTSLEAGVKIVE